MHQGGGWFLRHEGRALLAHDVLGTRNALRLTDAKGYGSPGLGI